MSKMITKLIVAAAISVAVPSYASVASAAPVAGALAIKNSAANHIETVRWGGRGWGWGGRGWGGRGWGWGFGGGLAAGAIIGGALAAPYYYGGGYYGGPYYAAPYYDGEPGYYQESYGGGGGGVDYCMRRFRSYDPRSGTYLGYDGMRHPCP